MPEPSDSLARELRAAVLASDHARATRLAEQYTQTLSEHWMLLTNPERVASPLPKESLELLNWVREMTIMRQALDARHLAAVEKASRYQAARALYLRSAALGA